MRYDTLIKGGHLVDPAARRNGRFDVALAGGRVAAVDAEIPPDAAYRVIDAAGRYVTPGLIDFHSHVFHQFTYWGVDPDTIGPCSGVTTWVDAGSAGAITLPGFRRYIAAPATSRVRASQSAA